MSDWLTSEPQEDAGAQTRDRFRYQDHCAVRHLLTALACGRSIALICELHSDFLVVRDEGCEAVSVKHREPSRSPFTRSSLLAEGGVAKLYETWRNAGRSITCRLMTNAGLSTGTSGGQNLARFAQLGSHERDPLLAKLATVLEGAQAEIDEFFRAALVIDEQLPARPTIGVMQQVELLGPAYLALGEVGEGTADEYRALLTLVANAGTDQSPISRDARLALTEKGSAHAAWIADATIADRRVTTDDAAKCLLDARTGQAAARLPAEAPQIPETKMVRKLAAGGIATTGQRLAMRLRNSWYAVEAEVRDLPQAARQIAEAEALVHRYAGDAQNRVCSDDAEYGVEMLADLRAHLSESAADASLRDDFRSAQLLEGLAYELTDRCDIWWSAEDAVDFDGAHDD